PVGYLIEAAALREAEADEALNNVPAALDVYERLSHAHTTAPDDVLMHMGRAAKASGNAEKATEAFSRVVYEFPFSDGAIAASAAGAGLDGMTLAPLVPGTTRYKLEPGRGERLFAAKRYTIAKPIYVALHRNVSADDRELVDLRLAECDYFLKRPRNTKDSLK